MNHERDDAATIAELRAEVERLRTDGDRLDRVRVALVRSVEAVEERGRALEALADDLAGALAIAVLDAHPTYGSTAGWRGGVGGAALTTACSMIDPPPGQDWLDLGLGLLIDPLRAYLRAREKSGRPLDLDAAKAKVETDLRAALAPPA